MMHMSCSGSGHVFIECKSCPIYTELALVAQALNTAMSQHIPSFATLAA